MASVLHAMTSDLTPSSALQKERLVILGSGWASHTLIESLDLSLYDVVCVSPVPHRQYTPALASVVVGSLTLFAAVEAVKKPGLTVFSAECVHIDVKKKRIECQTTAVRTGNHSFALDYDVLVIGVGCGSQDFGVPGVKEHGHFLKTAEDALHIRNRILQCFDEASLPGVSDAEKRRLLSFVIVGGGATGVELAAELADLIKSDLARLYGDVVPFAQISVYDVAPAILPGFDDDLKQYAASYFQRENVRVETEKHIERVDQGVMTVKEQGKVDFGLLIWSTGLDAVPLLKRGIQGTKQDEKTRNLLTDDFLRVLDPGDHPIADVFACGDLCTPASGSLPPVGSVAEQQARYLADQLRRRAMRHELSKFEFKTTTKVSYLGNQQSVKQKGDRGSTAGRGAWALWREEYARTLSVKRRIILGLYWLLSILFGRDLVRI